MRRTEHLQCVPLLTGALLSAVLIGPVLADQVPAEFHGTWSQRCSDPAAPKIQLEPDKVTITISRQQQVYAGVITSHTWIGGARASGKQVWLPISQEPNGPFAFVLTPPPYGRKGMMTLAEGHPDHGREVKNLVGSKFSHCHARKVTSIEATSPSSPPRARTNWIATPVTEHSRVQLNGTASDRRVTLSGACSKPGGPRFQGSLYGYPGNALKRIDDQDEPVAFAVTGQDGIASFPARMVYYAPERAWVLTDVLPAAFVEAFARGETLTIRNGKGMDVVSFGLNGAAIAAQTMRKGCGG